MTLVGDGSSTTAQLRSQVEKVLGMKTGSLPLLPVNSPLCFAFLVKQQDLVPTVAVLHNEFFGQAECEPSPAAHTVRNLPKGHRASDRLLPFAIQPVFNS